MQMDQDRREGVLAQRGADQGPDRVDVGDGVPENEPASWSGVGNRYGPAGGPESPDLPAVHRYPRFPASWAEGG